jgi:exopolysaccharide biosynthesis protein
MRRVLANAIVFFLIAGHCAAETTTTRPYPGVTLESDVWADPPMRFWIVTIDLTDPRIHLKVSRGGTDPQMTPPWEVTLMPVSKIAQRDGLSIAVNGNLFQGKDFKSILGRKLYYFEGNWARVSGWAMSDGVPYSLGPVAHGFPSLVIDDLGQIRIGVFDQMPSDAKQIVSGTWQIVLDGKITMGPHEAPTPMTVAAPHTVVGIDRTGKKLILFVVDGRRDDYSVGMEMYQLGQQLRAHRCWNALVLDGGGSTTLVMRGQDGNCNVINRPSDGHDLPVSMSMERSVANALGIVIDPSGAATRPSQP